MNSPRWKKLIRDLQSAQGRMAMMVIAIAVSIFSVGTFLERIYHCESGDESQLSRHESRLGVH
jgi:uncharacterized membrane protein YwzB